MTPQELHAAVWRVRAEIGHVWLTPPPIDCLRYALTEVGEAMDASLRAQRPGDARNHARDLDVLDELGDCAIMLCSALPAIEVAGYGLRNSSLDDIAGAVAHALSGKEDRRPNNTLWALDLIYAYPGFTTTVALLRLDRIRVKYTKETETVSDAEMCDFCAELMDECTREYGSAPLPAWLTANLVVSGYFVKCDEQTHFKVGWRGALALYARRHGELACC